MQLDTTFADRCPCCGKPRRIAHLLDLYERNYQLLERLVPELELPFERAVSRSATDLPLVLTMVERAPYTSEVVYRDHRSRPYAANSKAVEVAIIRVNPMGNSLYSLFIHCN